MSDSGDLLYQAVRFAFTGSLLLFLLLLIRATLREIDLVTRDREGLPAIPEARAWLQAIETGSLAVSPGDVLDLDGRTVVGRSPESDLVLDDPSISSLHAVLAPGPEGWVIEDLGSTNGTYLSGRPILHPALIEHGDTIQVGRVRFRFMC